MLRKGNPQLKKNIQIKNAFISFIYNIILQELYNVFIYLFKIFIFILQELYNKTYLFNIYL